MKKELLIASALVGSVGLAGVAEAASMSMSGSHKVGVKGLDLDSVTSTSTQTADQQSNFSISVSETTDSGIKISTGFTMINEGASSVNPDGLTLTFTDGSSLDLVEAGNASDSHDVAIPSAAGEFSVPVSSLIAAPGGIDFGGASDAVGFEFHTAADAFGVDGLKASVSASFNSEATAATTGAFDSGYGVGVTYVTTAGDTSVTFGAGMSQSDFIGTDLNKDESTAHAGLSATTGNLTVAAGFGSGDTVVTTTNMAQRDGEVTAAGVKYVSGDMTFNVGILNSNATDETYGTGGSALKDELKNTTASVSYAVASGVTANIGWKDQEVKSEGTVDNDESGSAWYVGATISF
jgi:hypothetical protein